MQNCQQIHTFKNLQTDKNDDKIEEEQLFLIWQAARNTCPHFCSLPGISHAARIVNICPHCRQHSVSTIEGVLNFNFHIE
jgi:hypothetical protein